MKIMRRIFLSSGLGFMTILNSVACSSLYYNPDRTQHFPPTRLGYSPEELTFHSTKDKTRLHGWWFPAKLVSPDQKPKGTVVQFHGNSQNLTYHYTSLVWLTEHGYNLFSFDYRGYGKSAGDPEPKGAYEDGLSALNLAWAKHRQSGGGNFVLYTQSMGGMIGVRAFADFVERGRTSLLVIDSSFPSFKDIVQERLQNFFMTWPLALPSRFLVSDRWAMQWVLPTIAVPVLVIHDKKDPVVGFEHGQKIFGLLEGRKDFWELDDGGHVNIFTNSQAHRSRFVQYMETL